MIIRTGLGQIDTTGTSSDPFANLASGFGTAFSDLTSQFGFEEWALLIGGAIVLFVLVSGTTKTVGATRDVVKRRRARRKKRKQLLQELEEL